MIGKTISHYKVMEELGRGGMGVVYKAEDTKLKRTVALKFLPQYLTRDEEANERFIQEAQTASALDHPNICTIHEIDETEGSQMFIVMAYYEGETLKEKIEDGPLDVDQALDIAVQVAEGLREAHEKGIIHRDIKSANIMVTTKGQAKIMDFGLAKLAGQVGLTKTGTTMGTIAYMSPEQARGEEVDHRSDIWSLGVVLYEMLTGHLPFRGEIEAAMMYSIMNEDPEPIAGLRSGVPLKLEQIVDKAMGKNKEDRFQSAKEMLVEVKQLKRDTDKISDKVLEDVPGSEFKGSRDQRRKVHRKSLWLGLGAIALVVIAVTLILTQGILKRDIIPSKIKANSIAVMYFDNHTDEPNLEKILVDMLTTNLSRYEELEVVSSQRLFDIFELIGKDKIETIDKHVATDVANRAQVKTMLLGSIIKIGSKIRINTQLCDVQTGSNIGSEQVEGSRLEDIFTMADSLTTRVRDRLEVSVAGVGKQPLRIADVTTSSYQAYRYFIRGKEAYEKRYNDDARQFLENAINFDSTFALAYLYLSWVNVRLAKFEESHNAIDKAKLYAEKATDKERLFIEADIASTEERFQILQQMAKKFPNEKRVHSELASYYRSKGQYDQAIEECKRAIELDPNYGSALNILGHTFAEMGNFEKSIDYFKMYASLFPEDANPFDSMGEVYFKMGLLDEALEKYKQASANKPGFSDWQLSYIYALKEDYSAAMHWIDQYIANAPSKSRQAGGHWWRGIYHYLLGRYDLTQHDLLLTKTVAETGGSDFWLHAIDWLKGWIYYDRGEFEPSKKHFKSWTDYATWAPARFQSWWIFLQGLVDVKEGGLSFANVKQKDMKVFFPEMDKYHKELAIYYNELLLAEILIAEGTPEKVAHFGMKDTLKVITRLHPRFICSLNVPFMQDVWARAYYQAGDLERAIAEYERLITFDPKSKDRRLINPRYHYHLAKLYEEKGWPDKAIEQYEKFLEIWKNADEDLPELIDAKKRFLKLTGEK